MGPQVEAKVLEKQISLRKIDINNWDSDVAKQYRIDSLPALWLYKDRKLVTQDREEVFRYLSS